MPSDTPLDLLRQAIVENMPRRDGSSWADALAATPSGKALLDLAVLGQTEQRWRSAAEVKLRAYADATLAANYRAMEAEVRADKAEARERWSATGGNSDAPSDRGIEAKFTPERLAKALANIGLLDYGYTREELLLRDETRQGARQMRLAKAIFAALGADDGG